ncbi:TraB/GumN family protein [Chelativorans sp. M5D2P16]|uniref:TraB/GumN family protein n=1 Tax=Chelativorans sp. M5D2P16 TaxID=3095678 RepID=UPI002ACAA8C3|nr:TraB/GumN family protein [Chelativorans sp. M5D2P16]MDZ5699262.1 TraB/GumN family protein [Chelativorans sp. M5D2P16]
MKRARSIADRIAEFSLGFVSAVNLLFVLVFMAMLLIATGRLRAEEAACAGRDLVEELAERDPALLEEMQEEAAAAENGRGLLWRVEGRQGPPSYLFGTMHVSDPRVVDLPSAAREAFAEAGTIVIETTEVLDEREMMAAMAETPGLMMFPPGEDLTDHLTPREYDIVSAALAARGVPLQSVVKMKPWMLIALVSLPACELERQEEGALVLDAKLADQAQAEGKRLVGLESLREQLGAMASLPMETHVHGLIGTLALKDRADDMIETLIGLYLRGETGMFWPALDRLLPDDEVTAQSYAAFEEAMVKARNRQMAERAVPLIEAGGAFIAVGAMHLPGPDGLVSLLREAGYTVTGAD